MLAGDGLGVCGPVLTDTWSSAHIHQRLPLTEVFAPVTKFVATLNPFNCRVAVRSALREALAEPAGPSYLALSADRPGLPGLVAVRADRMCRRSAPERGDERHRGPAASRRLRIHRLVRFPEMAIA